MPEFFKGSTSHSPFVALVDSTTGLPKTGIAYTAVTASYCRSRSARVAITPAPLAAATTSYTSGGWYEVDATNQPGVYRFDVPDAAFATGVEEVVVSVKATGCRTEHAKFILVDWNKQVAAIPNVAAGASGGLPTGDASGRVLLQPTQTGVTIPTVTTVTTTGTVTTVSDKTGYALSGTQTFNLTGSITGNLSGSVGSVTGAVASVTGNVGGSVASVTAGVTLAAVTHTGATIPTVTTTGTATNLTNLPSVPTDWLTAAGVKADAVTKIQAGLALATQIPANFTTATFASAGVFATAALANAPAPSLGATAPAGWINTAAFASGATLPRVTLADTVTTLTGHTAQTGDSFARIGATGSGLTSLASQASVNTVDDFLDTEIAAIKAKTDALPSMASGAVAGGSTASAVIVSGLPSGKSYVGQRLYHGPSGEARIIAGQSFGSGNYTFTFTGSAGTPSGPFSSVTTSDVVTTTT